MLSNIIRKKLFLPAPAMDADNSLATLLNWVGQRLQTSCPCSHQLHIERVCICELAFGLLQDDALSVNKCFIKIQYLIRSNA